MASGAHKCPSNKRKQLKGTFASKADQNVIEFQAAGKSYYEELQLNVPHSTTKRQVWEGRHMGDFTITSTTMFISSANCVLKLNQLWNKRVHFNCSVWNTRHRWHLTSFSTEKSKNTRENRTPNALYMNKKQCWLIDKEIWSVRNLTLAISSGVRAPFMSCLFANISRDAPDSLWQMNKQIRGFTRKEQMNKKRKKSKEEQDNGNTLH